MSLALPIVTDDPDMIRRLKRRGLVEVKTYRKTKEPTGSPTAARGGEQSWQ
jgi:Mn-dependent DtxR family transcriptional regulator